MVAVIHQSSSLRNILNYNEQKVKQGLAVCLEAGYYPMDATEMNFHQKLRRLEKLTELNENTKVNSVHISLNFDPSEVLSDDLLREIAEVYLDKIGFGSQPYLLYKHLDSGHPHVHLVTTNIQASGKRIRLHNLGKIQSKKARKEIEIAYGLVKADEAKEREVLRSKPVNAQKVIYGQAETKRAIGNVLGKVLQGYAYTSLPELNAVLKLYNITADAGFEGSRVKAHDGLVYRVLDEQGNKVGTPIKASLYQWTKPPTLKFLRERYAINAGKKDGLNTRVKNAIDLAMLKDKMELPRLISALKKEGIDVVVRQNTEGLIYGLTYVDHIKAVVFNGSDLGKAYSAKGILERCRGNTAYENKTNLSASQKQGVTRGQPGILQNGYAMGQVGGGHDGALDPLKAFTDALVGADEVDERMDFELKRTRRKKKKRRVVPD
jgi:hypothetical protein